MMQDRRRKTDTAMPVMDAGRRRDDDDDDDDDMVVVYLLYYFYQQKGEEFEFRSVVGEAEERRRASKGLKWKKKRILPFRLRPFALLCLDFSLSPIIPILMSRYTLVHPVSVYPEENRLFCLWREQRETRLSLT